MKYAWLILLLLSGCSTMMEAISPNDTTTGYVQQKNRQGETVYRRVRVRESEPTPPAPYEPPPPPYVPPAPYEPPPPAPYVAPVVDSPAANGAAPAETEKHHGFALGGELSSDGHRAHASLLLFKEFGFVEGKLGLAVFNGNNDTFAGGDLGIRPKFEFLDHFAVFGGAGVYGGDAKKCSGNSNVEMCEKKFLFAGYVEAGVYLWNVSLFARSYNIEEAGKQIPSDTFYGIGVRTSF